METQQSQYCYVRTYSELLFLNYGNKPLAGGAISANWAALKAMMGVGRGTKKRQRPAGPPSAATGGEQAAAKRPEAVGDVKGLTPVLALDCEMVGVGPEGSRSTLARCVLICAAFAPADLEACLVVRLMKPLMCLNVMFILGNLLFKACGQ